MSKKHDFQLQRWKLLIQDRIKSGMKVRDWCDANGVTKDAYYYWLAKLREDHYEEAVRSLSTEAISTNTFVELPMPNQSCQIQPTLQNVSQQPAAVIQKDRIRMEIFSEIPSLLLEQILKAVSDV